MRKPDWPTAAPYVPEAGDLRDLAEAADHCEGCPLFRDATQVVFGAGPADAGIVIVGEQPGDQEDRAGEPFVGPAGRLLDSALEEAGIDRTTTYVTNATLHPSAILRSDDRAAAKAGLVADLRVAADALR